MKIEEIVKYIKNSFRQYNWKRKNIPYFCADTCDGGVWEDKEMFVAEVENKVFSDKGEKIRITVDILGNLVIDYSGKNVNRIYGTNPTVYRVLLPNQTLFWEINSWVLSREKETMQIHAERERSTEQAIIGLLMKDAPNHNDEDAGLSTDVKDLLAQNEI